MVKNDNTTPTLVSNDSNLEERRQNVFNITNKYPDMCPVYITRASTQRYDKKLTLKKYKYLIPKDNQFCQLTQFIRSRLDISYSEGLYFYVVKRNTSQPGTIPPMNMNMGELYNNEKDEDGFLYIVYQTENTFGFC